MKKKIVITLECGECGWYPKMYGVTRKGQTEKIKRTIPFKNPGDAINSMLPETLRIEKWLDQIK